MKRRNFLKIVTGLLAVPTTMCSAKSTQKSSLCNTGSFSHDNIKVDGTFEEWVDSIAKEIERSLAVKSKEPDADWYEVECVTKTMLDCCYEDGEQVEWLTIIVYMKGQISTNTGWEDQEIGRIGFLKNWFDRNHHPKTLRRTLEVRYIDFMWCLFEKGRKYALLVKKLGLDCSKPYYYHGKN